MEQEALSALLINVENALGPLRKGLHVQPLCVLLK